MELKDEYISKGIKVTTPQPGGQEAFVRSNVDVCFYGGVLNCGKTYGAILSMAEWTLIPEFRAVFTRRNLADTKAGGGMLDDIKRAYGQQYIVSAKESDSPRIIFRSGSFVDITHIADENPQKLMERVKGWQYDMVYLDELTSYEWSTFNTIITRNRGTAGIGSKIRGTTNPKKNHWLRKFLDLYIGLDGFIKPEMDRRVMYFFITGETVDTVVWGETKAEVYKKCKIDIDRKLATVNKGKNIFTYENLIKSFSFILGNISENLASIENNKDYIGSVAASGGKKGQILLEGNWNIDEEDESEAPIPSSIARQVFMNDPQTNGDWWVTADLADKGTDNFVALVWNGLHIIDMVIMEISTPRENAQVIHGLAKKYDIADSHIVFDGNNAAYMNDYIPDAVPFISYLSPVGMYARNAKSRKAEAFMRLQSVIKGGFLSFDDKVARRIYNHQKLNNDVTVEAEFIEECSVVRFIDDVNGKKRLMTKKEMNQALGRGRSMDLLDPIAIRMYPLAIYEYGSELGETSVDKRRDEDEKISIIEQARKGNIFNDSFWA